MGHPAPPNETRATMLELVRLTPAQFREAGYSVRSLHQFPPEMDLVRSLLDHKLVEITVSMGAAVGNERLNVVFRGLHEERRWYHFRAEVFRLTLSSKDGERLESVGWMHGRIRQARDGRREGIAILPDYLRQMIYSGKYSLDNESARAHNVFVD